MNFQTKVLQGEAIEKVFWSEPFSKPSVVALKHVSVRNFNKIFQKFRARRLSVKKQNRWTDGRTDRS